MKLVNPLVAGVGLLVASTLTSTLADATVKDLAERLEAPQVFFLSGLIMALLSVLFSRAGTPRGQSSQRGLSNLSCLRSSVPGLLIWRSVATVAAGLGFFYAIKLLPLAEIFLFVGLMPLIAAVLSRVLLGEKVEGSAVLGLVLGLIGVAMLFPAGSNDLSLGHLAGFAGAFCGTASLVLSRLMARREMNTLVQLFWPNLALAAVGLVMLPALWQPMSFGDIWRICLYSMLLFVARWTMVLVMQRLRAAVALPLMNIQFVWMVAIGYWFFAEIPAQHSVAGALLVMLAGMIALMDQARIERAVLPAGERKAEPVPAE